MMHLDSRLESTSVFVVDLELCHARLSHNAAFPWLLLIPRHVGLCELIDLSVSDQHLLMAEIALASHVMRDLFAPTKINVASLGNVVPQLHIHVIARYDHDSAWPGPVWNSGIETIYTVQDQTTRIQQLQHMFG